MPQRHHGLKAQGERGAARVKFERPEVQVLRGHVHVHVYVHVHVHVHVHVKGQRSKDSNSLPTSFRQTKVERAAWS